MYLSPKDDFNQISTVGIFEWNHFCYVQYQATFPIHLKSPYSDVVRESHARDVEEASML